MKQNISGILLLNKPLLSSSNQILQQIKRLFNAAKAGHTGSLDVLASGMLPICFGEATKFSQYMLDADKSYFAVGKLGERTTTCDAEGEVIETKPVHISLPQLQDTLQRFLGKTQQIPSMYSALKHEGKPLYQYARQGVEIERVAREINISSIKLLDFSSPYFSIEVHSSKGTYIRNLVDDIGQALGCGAYVAKLHRLTVANFLVEQMVELEEIKKLAEAQNHSGLLKLLLPIDIALQHIDMIQVSAMQIAKLRQGQFIQLEQMPEIEKNYRVYDIETNTFHGLVKLDNHLIKPEKIIVQ